VPDDEVPILVPLAEAILAKHPEMTDAGGSPMSLGVQGALVVLIRWNDLVAERRSQVLDLLRKGTA
jgi:hypothetical protein